MGLTALKKLRALRYLLFKIRAFFGAISAFFAVKTPLSKSVLIPGTYLNHRGTEAQSRRSGWGGPMALGNPLDRLPGPLAQAGMGPGRWPYPAIRG